MDGKRGARAAGTDGTDFSHRQRVAGRYEVLASAKAFLPITGTIAAVIGAYSSVGYYFDEKTTGVDLGPIYPLVITLITLLTALLAFNIGQKVVDPMKVNLHKALLSLTGGLAILNIVGVLYELIVKQNFKENIILYPSLIAYALLWLVSNRSQTADDQILESIEKKA